SRQRSRATLLLGFRRIDLGLAHEHALLEIADRLVAARDDVFALGEAAQYLEVLLARHADLHGAERDLVVLADHEHAFDVLLADLLHGLMAHRDLRRVAA